MDELTRLATVFRALWLSGRPGGGKTLLAVVLSLRLLDMGFVERIVANVPITVTGLGKRELAAGEEPPSIVDAAIILDEAWGELGAGNDKRLQSWLAYPRKRNQVLFFPSVLPLVRSLNNFRVMRLYALTQVGIPCWLYRYAINTGERKPLTGYVPLWQPSQYFGLYDSFSTPAGWWVYERESDGGEAV